MRLSSSLKILTALFSLCADTALALDFSSELKAIITHNLNDPESARFRNVHASKTYDDVICGEVNWKNDLGGYVGYQPFWVDSKEKKSAIAPSASYEAWATALGCP